MPEDLTPPNHSVLLVDDEPALLRSASMALRTAEFSEVVTCDDSRRVMAILKEYRFGALVVDLTMPHLSGQQILQEVAIQHPDIPVIVMTATNDLSIAVQCMQDGAVDYLLKPVDRNRLVTAVRRALEMRSLNAELRSLREMALSATSSRHEAFAEMATQHPEMLRIFHYLELVAKTAHPVLITGESGTGKELVARAVHRASGRGGPFVAVNVAGLDDHMFSDTLFGHTRGAYTGADRERDGLVKKAADGTLFLDEIGDLALSSQVKLLRLLQEGTFNPLGSDQSLRIRARVVVATNCDVKQAVESGKFRMDLYYRLSAHQVKLPPLRARHGDLPLLVGHFLDKAASELGKSVPTVPRELCQLLATYRFPGNLRELEGMCLDAIAQHQGGILSLHSFREAIARDGSPGKLSSRPSEAVTSRSWPEHLPTLEEAEQALIDEALRRANGNQGLAASLLGITRQALNRRVVQQRKS
jgi:DNA-binding NtrC family response regulator